SFLLLFISLKTISTLISLFIHSSLLDNTRSPWCYLLLFDFTNLLNFICEFISFSASP
ncbi:unnamed protein product, partial [Arabidopsis halleri]